MTQHFDTYIPLAIASAGRNGVPPLWVLGVIGKESSFGDPVATWEPNAGEYSYGVMQVLGSTARGLGFNGSPVELLRPDVGIEWGTRYLAWLRQKYGDDFDAVLSAYNFGHPEPVAGRGYVQAVRAWMDQLGGAVEDNAPVAAIAGGLFLIWYAFRGPVGKRKGER